MRYALAYANAIGWLLGAPGAGRQTRIKTGDLCRSPVCDTSNRTCAEPELVETEEFLALLRFEKRNELQKLMVET